MGEIKNYGKCEFCSCVMASDLSGARCPSCLKRWEPVEHLFDEDSRALMQDSIDNNKDSHGYEWSVEKVNLEDTQNYKENCMIVDDKENSVTLALQARRSEALQMAYYTLHKLGHFNTGRLPGASQEAQLLNDIEETKEIARNNLRFILEG